MLTWFECRDNHQRYFCNPGDRIEDMYIVKYDKKGVRSLEVDPDNKKYTYDEIQSHADSVDINVILKRYQSGDVSALDRSTALYVDTSQMPDSYAGWFEMRERAKDYFYSLSPDVRSKFNNSVEQFLASEVEVLKEVARENTTVFEKKEDSVDEQKS